jgi:hypothetical protein
MRTGTATRADDAGHLAFGLGVETAPELTPSER